MANTKENSPPEIPSKSLTGSVTAKPEEILKRIEEEYCKYLHTLQEAWDMEEVNQRLREAFLNYVRALQEAGPYDALKSYEAYFNYLRACQEAWRPERVKKLFNEAYLDYVRALQQAWAQIDINALNANSLAIIGQNMLVVACYAGKTLHGS